MILIDSDVDFEALRQRYAKEREKRMAKDARRYVEVAGEFARYLDDPNIEASLVRDPIVEDIDVLIVGAGISGICTAARLREAGIDSIRIIEKGGDFGGTWYWNRYPGAACDIEAYIYLPMLEKTRYIPTQKYANAAEIFEYLRYLSRHSGLYDKVCFQTSVTDLQWQEEIDCWFVRTDRGDRFKARFVCLATGGLTQPKLPAIPGIETFKGHSFHTCRWDYRYTGGDSRGNLIALRDKHIAVVGTGATAVQVVPHLGRWSKHLYVFQRTPSAVDVRANRRTDRHWTESLQPGWQQQRMRNFEEMLHGLFPEEDLVADGWTNIARKLHAVHASGRTSDGATPDPEKSRQLADFKKMEEIRRRIDKLVVAPATAAALKPYYNTFCKRPCFNDDYLQTFNRSNVTLVDTNGSGVGQITAKGLMVDGREYEVDCIVYSTGFEVAAMTYRAGHFSVYGTAGRSLEEKWSQGFKSLHGILTHGFPNMMIVGGLRDGPASVNGTYIFDGQCQHVVKILKRCLNENVTRFEVTEEAEAEWARLKCEKKAPSVDKFLRECTPGFVNGEGTVDANSLSSAIYRGGSLNYFEILDAWITSRFDKDMVITTKS